MKIFLIGFMGSGKTTLGKQLAESLGYQFIDQDYLIEEEENMTINEIFNTKGESKFREIERYILTKLTKSDNIVVATGGGAPCFFDNAETMKTKGFSIYLRVSPQALFERLRNAQATRPLIKNKTDHELQNFIKMKLQEREPFYLNSSISIQSDTISCQDLLNEIRKVKE
jgi:shikimate kinase